MTRMLNLVLLVLFWSCVTAQGALCPYMWLQYGQSCYFMSNTNATLPWVTARDSCLDMDADLVNLDDAGEREWMLSQITRLTTQSHLVHDWWLGLNQIMDARTWRAANGTAVSIDVLAGKWMAGQPRTDINTQCVQVLDSKFLVDRCSNNHLHICERPVGKPLTCDQGWIFFGNMCYRHFNSPYPYDTAKQQCTAYGGFLPRVFDLPTQTNVWDWARQQGVNIWMDLKTVQLGTNYVYDWGNGTTLTAPTYWKSGLPRLGPDNCVELITTQGSTNSWGMVNCTERRQYTCIKNQGTCPNGWLPLYSTCYNIYSGRSRLAFQDAKTFCANLTQGASLVLLYSPDYVQYLAPYVLNSKTDGVDQLWIGISDNNGSAWTWVTNGGIGWANWAQSPPPNTPNKQDCVFISTSDAQSKWLVTSDCDAPKNFICQIPTNRAISTATPAPPVSYTCPQGYVLYKQTCLQLNVQDKTWDEARAACKGQNQGDLVRIPDSSTNNFVNSQINNRQGSYWIGFQDRQVENHFRWLDDNVDGTFNNWQPGEPNNWNGAENCVFIKGQTAFTWWDADCSAHMHYICQTAATQAVEGPTTTTPKPWSNNCGPYWENDPNSYSCYIFNTDRLAWLDARSACQARGGDLLSINSVEEQFYINGRVSTLGMNFFWIGANDRATESGWRWSDGSPMGFVNWDAGQPDNQGNQDCIVISQVSGRWTDFSCSERYGYICEKMGINRPTPTLPATTPGNVPAGKAWGCPPSWRGFQGYCYTLVPFRGNFRDAQTGCGQQSATLASIHSEAENSFIFSLLPKTGVSASAFLGLTDQARENSFTWTDGSPITYTKWTLREPDNKLEADCVVMYQTNNGEWADVPCSYTPGNYVCKRPMFLQDLASLEILKGCTSGGGLGFRAQCYVFVTTYRNWTAAQADCRTRHGNLATVNDVQIQAFLSAELVSRPGIAYWIGLKNRNTSDRAYAWATNYTVDFTSWSANHTGNERGTCVAMRTGRPVGLWTDYPCSQIQLAICEYPRSGYTTPPLPPTTPTPSTACPSGWSTYQSQCIMATNLTQAQRLSWMDARAYCRNLGGDLVTLKNKTMENWLYTQVLHNVTSLGYWWIGLNDRDSEKGHVWSDGSGVTYTNWARGEPNDFAGREDCVQWVLPRNNWNDDVCDMAYNFICSIPRGTQLPTTIAPASGISSALCGNSSWLYYSGHCYLMSPPSGSAAQKTWYDARRTCNSLGGDLVSVLSIDENSFLTYAMSRHAQSAFWIGLTDLDGTYKWTDNSPLTYISWRPNQPDDAYGGESCVESSQRGDWNDNNCQDKKAYICKQLPGRATARTPTLATPTGGCPVGFTSVPILNNCYKVAGLTNDTMTNYTGAVQACKATTPPATLVSIHNSIEQRYITSLTALLPTNVWIGLNDMKQRSYFEWVDNSEVDFTHWGPNQPDENTRSNNPNDRRDCVMLNTRQQFAGNWDDQKCSNLFAYVCETSRVPGLPTLSPDVTGCAVSGYTNHQGNCYIYYDTRMTWQNAQARCQQDGASLASATDLFKQAVIGLLRMPDLQHANNNSDVWMGMAFDAPSRTFRWLNGYPVQYTKWANGEPDQSGPCVRLDSGGNWHDDPCNNTFPFVCQINTGTPPPTTSTVSGACPDSTWSPYGEYCYQLVTSRPRSWPEARYACEMQGSKLTSAHSQPEMSFVVSLFNAAASKGVDRTVDVWLGLSKGLGVGFSWLDSTELEFQNWGAGEPSDKDGSSHQDCVQAAMTDGTWNDVSCFDPNYYVCKTIQKAATTTQYRPTTQGTNAPTQTNAPQTNAPQTNAPKTNAPVTNAPLTNAPNTNAPYTIGPPTFAPVTNAPVTNAPLTNAPPTNAPPNPGSAAGQTGNSGSPNSSISGGAVAGIVIATIAILAIAGVAVYYIRSRNQGSRMGTGTLNGDGGFDNALYERRNSSSDGAGGNVHFGHKDEDNSSA